MHWVIFALVYGIQIFRTHARHIETCVDTSYTGTALYFLHHLLDVYLFWAPLFLETRFEWRVYCVVAALVVTHWASYKNRCIATVIMNRRCGFPEEQWLDSLKNQLGLERVYEPFHFVWIGAVFLYAARTAL